MSTLALLLIIGLLSAVLGAVCWLAVETRRVWHALAVYSAAVQSWQATLHAFQTPREDAR